MPSAKASVPHNRKRQLIEAERETDFSSPPPAKQQRSEDHRRHRTPSSFWDNLSRLWLTRRALREFDRRTVWPDAPVPPHRTGKESVDFAKLKCFARHGGPSLRDLPGYPDPSASAPSKPTMSSNQSGSRKRAKTERESNISLTERKTSAYDRAFEQHLIDPGIYPHGHYKDSDDDGSVYPDNWEEIKQRIARPRPSLSPSLFTREEFRKFERTNWQALTEKEVMSKVFPIIAGTANIPSQENLRFTNLKDLTDGSITQAQPDFYDGARPEELNKQIQKQLGPYIVPSTNTVAPCLPNYFTEGKGPDGLISVGQRQALYDGALGARGIYETRSFIDPETAHDKKAYVITSTYQGRTGLLKVYTTHCTRSTKPNRDLDFPMTQLRGWDMTSDPDTFRQGAGALRNARDWAKEKRQELITAANSKALNADQSAQGSPTQSFVSLLSSDPAHLESKTSADELALDNGTCVCPTHRTPVEARTSFSTKNSSKISSNRRLKKKPVWVDRGSDIGYGDVSET